MSARRTTIMILLPGRNALSFAAPRAPAKAVLSALLLPLLTGAAAERCFRSLRSDAGGAAIASLAHVPLPAHDMRETDARPVTAWDVRPNEGAPTQAKLPALPALPQPPPVELTPIAASAGPGVTLATTVPTGPLEVAKKAVVSAQQVIRALTPGRRGEIEDVPANGVLRLQALHLDEEITVRPFDDQLQADPEAIAQINHLLRCRVTGEEIAIDPALISIMVRLSNYYNKPIQLVSGHRVPNTIGTKPTSQHAIGRAADIRIPGIGINELKRSAIKLGARGVGLYPEKGFVHVDVRQKSRFFWLFTAAQGEQPDMGMTRPARTASPTRDSEEDPEAGDTHADGTAREGASDTTAEEHAHAHDAAE